MIPSTRGYLLILVAFVLALGIPAFLFILSRFFLRHSVTQNRSNEKKSLDSSGFAYNSPRLPHINTGFYQIINVSLILLAISLSLIPLCFLDRQSSDAVFRNGFILKLTALVFVWLSLRYASRRGSKEHASFTVNDSEGGAL